MAPRVRPVIKRLLFKFEDSKPSSSSSSSPKTTTTQTTTNQSLNDDFPELTSKTPVQSQTKSEPQSQSNSNVGSDQQGQAAAAIAKRVQGDGDNLEVTKKPVPREFEARDKKFTHPPFASKKPDAPGERRQSGGEYRARPNSNRESDWDKNKYYAELKVETSNYREMFSKNRPEQVFKAITGDLFTADSSFALAHCVSLDYKMGAGIAKLFHEKYVTSPKHFQELKDQNQGIGGCSFQNVEGRFIYYMITKQYYFGKPLYSDLEKSLTKLRELCKSHGVKSLAMPQIAVGLDKLEWKIVENIINQVFAGSEINVAIYFYKPENNERNKPYASNSRTGAGPYKRSGYENQKKQ